MQIPVGLSVYMNEQILKFILKGRGTRNPKNSEKGNMKLGVHASSVKIYCVITKCSFGEGTHTQTIGIENTPEIEPHKYIQMVKWLLTKVQRKFNGEAMDFPTNNAGTIGYPHTKK